ncbi:methyltransferase domain-containing protein [Clostridium sp. YIM B02505]|uniref:Methyltransferase domain-containing protein n=1 Tax=Clostridium yunnanense TaxID=2800325 RepID=A0ABS1ETD3_9CLOT|nr:class I SAM-dependent methyltransferase [Clostridium yunnanense]MBK1812637.1 methyltransferase domain-containing protein [Clostridium yunnanense]
MNSNQYFDSIANKWNTMRSEYFKDEVRDRIVAKFNIKDKVVADLGCGTGFVSLGLARESAMVFSLDRSYNMLKELKASANNVGLKNIYPIKSSLDDLALFDESIDGVFINMALHHIVDAEKAIKEMYRVLKQNGTVLISDVYQHNGEWAREEMYDEWLGFTEEQIRKWLENAGFTAIKVEDTGLRCEGYSSKGEFTNPGIFMATAIKK